MKVKIIVAIIALLALFTVCYSAELYPSAEKTADALIKTGSGTYGGMIVITDATNACTVKVYDNTAASGTAILPTMTCPGDSSTSGVNTCVLSNINLGFSTGLYADMTVGGGGSCTYNVGRRSGR